jgi:CubicO group peptidase (beta-lactamase class C family)
MMLVEEGRLRLTDPVSRFSPEFKNPKVVVADSSGGTFSGVKLVPAEREITVHDLMTFTSGVGNKGAVPLLSGQAKFDKGKSSPDEDIGACSRRLAKLPLQFQPGTAWKYGTAGIIQGYLVEVVSGQRFDRFLAERIFRNARRCAAMACSSKCGGPALGTRGRWPGFPAI